MLDGGGGTDTLSYFYAAGPVSVSLAAVGAQATGASGTDTLINIENLAGSPFDDNLTGNANANTVEGGTGLDTITGGLGDDILLGGGGLDRFIFDMGFGRDRINDFTPGADVVHLSIALGLTDFADIDLNADGILNTGDRGVRISGADTIIDFGTDQLRIIGQTDLQSSDFHFV